VNFPVDRAAAKRASPWGRLDDFGAGSALIFPRFDYQVVADSPDEVIDAIAAADRATLEGRWVFGFVCYEAATGLNPDLPTVLPVSRRGVRASLPLVWFGVADPPLRSVPVSGGLFRYRTGDWHDRWSRDEYARAFSLIKDAIAAGRTYQCNLTTTLTTSFFGDAESFYADIASSQSARYCAYLELGRHVVASASPELFFEWSDTTMCTKPMKGTAKRGLDPVQDQSLRRELLASPKERAENLIIVDLLRNDLSKIAHLGSVRVPALFTAECYPTVWQLTSQITAEVDRTLALVDVFKALFPCGSVTGAPKPETMEIIQAAEGRARGVYCGAIGWVAPPTEQTRARFSVAIRTAHVDRAQAMCQYGVGSGITWGSNAASEYAELQAKTQILDPIVSHLSPA
jgi:para-aminobenzoate synthetase / 4-amino-4-deoxychorismate lyase